MITFSNLGSKGRLGNQLFQYAFLYCSALIHNYEACTPVLSSKSWHGQDCLLKKLSISLPENTYIGKNKYSEISSNVLLDDSDIDGFFQFTCYFPKYLNLLKKEFSIVNPKSIKEEGIPCIHIRLGDNIRENGEVYSDDIFGGKYYSFLKKTIESINSDSFLIMTGGSRNNDRESLDLDKKICSAYLLKDIDRKFIFTNNLDPIEDFQLMVQASSLILSPLSTYSLWAGYLNNNTVYANPDFYLDGRSHNLYLDHWKS